MNFQKVKISESLASLLQQMDSKQQSIVAEMISYYSNQYETLRKENNAESVSTAIHGAVEDAIKELISNEKEKTPSCGKGCSFCCYLKTDISDDEAVLLTEYSREIGFEIDYNYLEEQIVKTDEEFLKIPYAKRKCVFLNEEGACSVYEHRPIACRKLIVVSNSEDCDTENKSGERVARLASVEAESISVAVLNTRKSGGLAEMMIKAKNK
jgi:Fe-S-cluster containining protein